MKKLLLLWAVVGLVGCSKPVEQRYAERPESLKCFSLADYKDEIGSGRFKESDCYCEDNPTDNVRGKFVMVKVKAIYSCNN